jgi:hypothetical protein
MTNHRRFIGIETCKAPDSSVTAERIGHGCTTFGISFLFKTRMPRHCNCFLQRQEEMLADLRSAKSGIYGSRCIIPGKVFARSL